MRVLICGDRNWTDREKIKRRIIQLCLPPGSTIIHGGARGADVIAGEIGKSMGFEVIEFRADWEKYGKAAGPIRNKQMLDKGKPDLVIGFHSDIFKSKGTKNMLIQSQKRKISTQLVE